MRGISEPEGHCAYTITPCKSKVKKWKTPPTSTWGRFFDFTRDEIPWVVRLRMALRQVSTNALSLPEPHRVWAIGI